MRDSRSSDFPISDERSAIQDAKLRSALSNREEVGYTSSMDETPQEYTARILANVRDKNAWDVLASTPGRLRELIAGRTRQELARTADPARWSVVQILAHLADAEIVGAWRFRSVLASDGVPLQAYDQNAWATAFRYADTDPFASLQLFEANRSATLALLRRVDPALHANHSLHAERGKETIEHLVRLYAGHDLNHLAQVERLVAVGATPAAPL
jgi:hypothetical protein